MENKIFKNFLWKKKLKMTRERESVVKKVLAFKGHFEPEHLYVIIKNSGIKASRASVYRTLNLLVESGLVEKVTRTEKGNVYECVRGQKHHDHMICISCNKIIEFYSEKIERLQQDICIANGFTGVSHTLEIRGYCKKCAKGLQ